MTALAMPSTPAGGRDGGDVHGGGGGGSLPISPNDGDDEFPWRLANSHPPPPPRRGDGSGSDERGGRRGAAAASRSTSTSTPPSLRRRASRGRAEPRYAGTAEAEKAKAEAEAAFISDSNSEGRTQRQRQRQRRRRLLHEMNGDGPPCFVPDAVQGGADRVMSPSDLDYYREMYDHLVARGFPPDVSSRIGSVEVIRPGSLPSDSLMPGGPPAEVAILRLSSVLAFSSVVLNESKNGTVLVPRGGDGKQVYGDVAGFLLAVHHFNNGDGSVVREVAGINETCPVRFVADFYDSESSQTTAVDVFSRQILESPDRPPSALIGAWRSAVSVPLAILGGVYEVPQVSPLSTSTELDDVTQYTFFSRLVPSDAGTARATVDYLRSRRPDMRHMGVIYVNDAYGSAFHQAIQEQTAAIEPEEDRIYVKGSPFSYNKAVVNQEEIDLVIETLANTGYRVFFGVFYDEHYELIMATAVKFGIAGPGYVWIFSDGISTTFLDGRTYPSGSPLAVASQGIGILKAEGGRENPDDPGGYDRFASAWYGQGAETVRYNNCVGHPGTNSRDDPSIYYQAAPRFFADRELGPTAGATYTYDSVMAMGLAACGLVEEKEGKGADGGGVASAAVVAAAAATATATAAPSASSGVAREYFTGKELFAGFVRQRFEGASGLVQVDPATTSRDPTTAFFVLYNAVGTEGGDGMTTFQVDKVLHTTKDEPTAAAEAAAGDVAVPAPSSATDVFSEERGPSSQSPPMSAPTPAPSPSPVPAQIVWVDMPGKSYVYSDGTTDFPPPLPDIGYFETNRLNAGMRGAGVALAGIICATALFFSWWTYHNRNIRVVKASQPMFLQMVCAGTVLMGATIVTMSIDDGVASQAGCDAACILSPWFFAYGFVIAFSALFSKTWRINKIFHNPNLRRIKVTVKDVMLPFIILFSLNTVILTVWTVVSPLTWQRTYRGGEDQFGRPVESYGSCRGDTEGWLPYVVCILAVNLSVLVLANIQAYQARSITTEYSESRYIAIIMMSFLQSCFIGIPLLVLVADEPAANFFVRAGIIFVTCMAMLLLMFVPKMIFLRSFKVAESKKKALRAERETKRRLAMQRAAEAGFGGSTIRNTFGSSATRIGTGRPTTSIRVTNGPNPSMRRISDLEVDTASDHNISEVSNVAEDKASTGSGDQEEGTAASEPETATENKGTNCIEQKESRRDIFWDEGTTSPDAVAQKSKTNTRVPVNNAATYQDSRYDCDDYSAESGDISTDFDDLSTTSEAHSGIRIMNHPKAESRRVLVLKAQVSHLKAEKLALYDRICSLSSLLKEKGASDDELVPLTNRKTSRAQMSVMSESHRRLQEEIESEASSFAKSSTPGAEREESAPSQRRISSSDARILSRGLNVRFKSLKNLAGSGLAMPGGSQRFRNMMDGAGLKSSRNLDGTPRRNGDSGFTSPSPDRTGGNMSSLKSDLGAIRECEEVSDHRRRSSMSLPVAKDDTESGSASRANGKECTMHVSGANGTEQNNSEVCTVKI